MATDLAREIIRLSQAPEQSLVMQMYHKDTDRANTTYVVGVVGSTVSLTKYTCWGGPKKMLTNLPIAKAKRLVWSDIEKEEWDTQTNISLYPDEVYVYHGKRCATFPATTTPKAAAVLDTVGATYLSDHRAAEQEFDDIVDACLDCDNLNWNINAPDYDDEKQYKRDYAGFFCRLRKIVVDFIETAPYRTS